MRELLGERVAQTHVHAAFDLAFAQQRIHRPAHIVHRDNTLDEAGAAIDNRHLRRVAKRCVNQRIGRFGVTDLLRPIDEVFAYVVDANLAPAGYRCQRCLLHRARRHQRAARAGCLSEAQLPRGVHDDLNAVGIDAKFLSSNLQRNRVHALAHLGESVAHLDVATMRVGGFAKANHCSTQLAKAIAESTVLQPKPKAHCLASSTRFVVAPLDGIETRFGARTAFVHHLAGTPHLAGVDHVALTNLPARNTDLLGETIEHALHRELGLIGTKSAERSAHGVVGTRGHSGDIDGWHSVRTAGVASRALEHFHAHAGVCTRVANRMYAQTSELAVGIATGPILEHDRMTLGVHAQALFAAHGAFHRSLQPPRSKRRVRLITHVFFAAECTTV